MSNSTINIQKNHSIQPNISSIDVVLIGAGIMSTTLGMFLSILEPHWKIHIYERLTKPAQESSNAWNNAGTGHSAFCELNYTTYDNTKDQIDISKAVYINEAFEVSRQFWAYLIHQKILNNPKSFINNMPHMSFVWGQNNIYFLKKRFHALKNSILFQGMMYSEDPQQIYTWAPLLMQGRHKSQKIAATFMKMGTDINFGEITQQLLTALKKNSNFQIYLKHDVINIQHHNNTSWNVNVIDLSNHNNKKCINTKFLFIGAGGKSLNLLQTSKIPEAKGYAGFPVGGQFLMTKNTKIVNQHLAKVYGRAPMNTPPMSVPHIDTRILNGHKILLFGPFATFSCKFLKYGSWQDLFQSLNKYNILPVLQVGINNIELIKYLFNQLMMSDTDRIKTLREYYPTANPSDWTLIQAGQRVQIIKKDNKNKGVLQFGTEIISSHDKSLSVLLGASPGASTATSIALELLHIMFYKKIHSNSWKNKIKEIIPSYTHTLNNNPILTNTIRQYTCNALKLTYIEVTKNTAL